jgi:hypothetical protein
VHKLPVSFTCCRFVEVETCNYSVRVAWWEIYVTVEPPPKGNLCCSVNLSVLCEARHEEGREVKEERDRRRQGNERYNEGMNE